MRRMQIDELRWGETGLLPVVAQQRHSGEVRMLAFADRAAVQATLRTGEAHFHSRSRQALWRKGETSGHLLHVREVWADCDGDALLYLVDAVGPTCHTGEPSCFFQPLGLQGTAAAEVSASRPLPTLARLAERIAERSAATALQSYTRSLLEKGVLHLGDKLREEADELGRALASESETRVVCEAADLVYHLLVALRARQRGFDELAAELAERFVRSGHEEKRSRQDPDDDSERQDR